MHPAGAGRPSSGTRTYFTRMHRCRCCRRCRGRRCASWSSTCPAPTGAAQLGPTALRFVSGGPPATPARRWAAASIGDAAAAGCAHLTDSLPPSPLLCSNGPNDFEARERVHSAATMAGASAAARRRWLAEGGRPRQSGRCCVAPVLSSGSHLPMSGAAPQALCCVFASSKLPPRPTCCRHGLCQRLPRHLPLHGPQAGRPGGQAGRQTRHGSASTPATWAPLRKSSAVAAGRGWRPAVAPLQRLCHPAHHSQSQGPSAALPLPCRSSTFRTAWPTRCSSPTSSATTQPTNP